MSSPFCYAIYGFVCQISLGPFLELLYETEWTHGIQLKLRVIEVVDVSFCRCVMGDVKQSYRENSAWRQADVSDCGKAPGEMRDTST